MHKSNVVNRLAFGALIATIVAACSSGGPTSPPSSLPSSSASASPTAAVTSANPTTGPASPTPKPTPRKTKPPTPPPTPTPAPIIIDLQPTGADATAGTDPSLGNYTEVAVTVKNFGTDPSKKFQVATTCLGFTETQQVSSLDAKTDTQLSFRFYASVAGDATLPSTVVVDSNDRVKETKEGNNDMDIPASGGGEFPTDYCKRAP